MAVLPFLLQAAGAQAVTVEELGRLSLEQLAQIEVTSVSRRPEPLSRAAGSVFVITDESIRRAAPASLPEALRLAPNLNVARVETLNYVASARGFNGYEASNKLLVLIDGRSVYNTLQSGIFWDAQNVLLADLDRIEVISGPGGTLWGSNAVNGVVNVLSKNAGETQGVLATGTVGSERRDLGLRYGGTAGEVAYRVYGMAFEQRAPESTSGADVSDDWDGAQGGFRADWSGDVDSVTLQGDLYRYDTNIIAGPDRSVDFHLRGSNILGRWTRLLDGGSSVVVQGYFDRADRNALSGLQEVETYDLEARHILPAGRHTLVWGGGYRWIHDDYVNPLGFFELSPQKRWLQLGNLFAQDEIALADDLSLTIGLKLEDSSFSGTEFLPNARLAWQASDTALLWTAVSRAARAPNRIERELVAPGVLIGGEFRSERVTAFEVGYRGQPLPRTTLSVTAFYNLYDGIRTTEPVGEGALPLWYANGIKGETYGLEAWGDIQLASWWRVGLGLTTLEKDLRVREGRRATLNPNSVGNDPDWQAQLRSQMDMTGGMWLDVRLRTVDSLPAPEVPSYTALDVTFGWPVREGLELILSGANLLDERHSETGPPPDQRAFRREVSLSARWRF